MNKWIIYLVIIILFGCMNQSKHHIDNHAKKDNSQKEKSPSLLSEENILIIAHRGASGYAPEHTIYSYAEGEKMHSDYIEIDLQMTKDGKLIALHDSDVSRTTNSEGEVKDLLYEEIRILDAGSWFNEENPDLAQSVFKNATIPTLEEIFEHFGTNSNYYIETKRPEEYPEMVNQLVETLNKYDLLGEDVPRGKVIIQSFSEDSLRELHELDPSIPLIQLISFNHHARLSQKQIDKIRSYAVGIGPNYQSLSEPFVHNIRDAGLLLHPYTVNKKEDMERLINWGVTGMFTNYPDRLKEVIEETTYLKKEE
ncbi:glycerophosphodiester phosphodiesterase [Pseudogracilibacillus auburnensis]|nr:glycerophosphodiester phosphodiesterase [Pseudogracilibacillus auburnensis]